MKLVYIAPSMWIDLMRPDLDCAIALDPGRLSEAMHILKENRDALCLFGAPNFGLSSEEAAATRRLCEASRDLGIPSVFWNTEDPNHYPSFVKHAAWYDIIMTSDADMIEAYRQAYPGKLVGALPFACQPRLHKRITTDEQVDFMFVGNPYPNAARLEGVTNLLIPIAELCQRKGLTFVIHSYEHCHDQWPAILKPHLSHGTSYLHIAHTTASARVCLNINNQLDSPTMCSMRVFETLGCAKPLLSYRSRSFEELGFGNGEHLAWASTPEEAVEWAERLIGDETYRTELGLRGQRLVYERHTYWHRLETIREMVGRWQASKPLAGTSLG